MDLAAHLSIQAHANRLANHRLHGAMASLGADEFHAPRTSFFPSLSATLNHLLAVDLYYIGALHGDAGIVQAYRAFQPAGTVAELAARQAVSDQRLIDYCLSLTPERCAAEVALDRGDHVQRDAVGHVLAHLFMHQTHHRGQAHAMLAGTAIAPPQLDKFLMPSEAHLRVAEMQALGWREEDVYRQAASTRAR